MLLRKSKSTTKTASNLNTYLKTNDNDKLKFDKYLSDISPLKPRKYKNVSKVINIPDKQKKPFSVTDTETMGFNGNEIPVCIFIKTENNLNLFLIDLNLFKIDVEMGIKDYERIFFLIL